MTGNEFESKDITDDIILKVEDEPEDDGVEETESTSKSQSKIPEEDHPAITLLDMAFNQSIEFCKSQKLPEPNKAVYENFSRPFLNQAFWHYLPEGDLPDDPKLALLLGFAGLGFAYIPTIMAFWQKEKAKAENENEAGKNQKPKPIKEKEDLRKKAVEAEKEKQEQIKQNEDMPPIVKKLQYESFAGL